MATALMAAAVMLPWLLTLAASQAANPTVFTSVYLGKVHTYSSSPTSVDITMHAPGSGGECLDATSGTAIGTACAVDLTGTITTNKQCAGKGTVRFTYTPSSGLLPQTFNGTLVLHPRGGSFVGALLPLSPVQLGGAHLHFILNEQPCGLSQQQPGQATGTFAGIYSEVG